MYMFHDIYTGKLDNLSPLMGTKPSGEPVLE